MRLLALALACTIASTPAIAFAQGDAPAPVVIAPPTLKSDSPATYPSQALTDAVRETVQVTVIVTVDAQGHVKDAKVDLPRGHGFDEAAVEAARKLEYTPATRNGTPISAMVKYIYTFAPPPARYVGRVMDQKTAAPIKGAVVIVRDARDVGDTYQVESQDDGSFVLPALPWGLYRVRISAPGYLGSTAEQEVAPGQEVSNVLRLEPEKRVPVAVVVPDEDIEEITVHGKKAAREVTVRTMDQRELTKAPGSNGDALRALTNLPGLARPPALTGLLLVRGSAPQETGIFVDGTQVPLAYHFGGLSAVVPTELISKIDFYPGNFSTQFGRLTGGVVDIGLRDPKKDKIHGMAQADLIDARLVADIPLGKGWAIAIAGRRSYVDTWLKPVLESTGASVTTAPVYYDGQISILKELSKKASLRLSLFGSDDRLEVLIRDVNASAPTLAGQTNLHTGFWRFQALFRAQPSATTSVRAVAAVGQDTIDFSIGDLYFTFQSYPISGRAEVAQKLGPGATLDLGIDMVTTPYDVNARLPIQGRPGQPPGGPFLSTPPLVTKSSSETFRPGVYAELELVPWKGARVVPGIRADYTGETGVFDFGPRVTARQDIGPAFPRTTAKGGVGLFSQPPLPQQSNSVFGQPNLISNKAIMYSLGAEREITRQLEVSAEAYYKQYDDLVVSGLGNAGVGRAYGIEMLVRYKPDARFFGWIAYTISRSERQDYPGAPIRPFTFDQTHNLVLLGSYRLGRGWEVGLRFRLVSGNLYTPQGYGFYDANAGSYLPLSSFPSNNSRLPLFHQLDFRVDKKWTFKTWQFSMYLDVYNAYNAGNVEGVSYNYNYTQVAYAQSIPILPSIGMRGEF